MKFLIRLAIVLWLIGLALLYYQPISRERAADVHISFSRERAAEMR